MPALRLFTVVVCFTVFLHAPAPQAAPPGAVATANDNRTRAGKLENKVLTIRLEAVAATWRPEKDSGASRDMYAFAEVGREPQIPGPLVRIPEGTEIRAFVTNRIPGVNLKLHGFLTRPADNDSAIDLPSGSTQEARFKAGVVGTYFYWATAGAAFNQRNGPDATLTGAFVIDSAGAENTDDRIFVLSEWIGPVVPEGEPRKVSFGINGMSWPHTERLHLKFGEPVTWRVINGTVGAHPMHLHGTFYTIESRGSALRDVHNGSDGRRLVTTEQLEAGGTMTMRWVPDRVGNWLFHCHILGHVSGRMRLADMTPKEREAAEEHHAEHDPMGAMAGLVLGIVVQPGDETAAPDLEPHERTRKTLFLQTMPARYGGEPAYGFSLHDGDAAEPATHGRRANLSPTSSSRKARRWRLSSKIDYRRRRPSTGTGSSSRAFTMACQDGAGNPRR